MLNEFSKVDGYNIMVQILTVFLYNSNEQAENETKKTIPFTISSKGIKYFT